MYPRSPPRAQLARRPARAALGQVGAPHARRRGGGRRRRVGLLPRVRRGLRGLRLRRLHRDRRGAPPAPERGPGDGEVLVSGPGTGVSRLVTQAVRRHLVGPEQRWRFEPPPPGWTPPRVERTSLYLHVPFCRNCCPYCPYTKVPYRPELVGPYTRAALLEVDRWADAVGDAEVTSIYVGGGTPTLALGAVASVLARMRERFRMTGDACIETGPADVDERVVEQLHACGVELVSLGVQSFDAKHLATIGRRYEPAVAESALALLAAGGFASVNADIMFALPGQSTADVLAALDRAAELGADQVTTYPLFTFPYTSVGEYLHLRGVRMPDLATRREQYRAITGWAERNGFARVSVWGFKRGDAPRYSSVTRDGYLGIGPGSGSHLPDGFTLNTFDLGEWERTLCQGRSPIALRMPFDGEMGGWWWLYWRFYDTRIPMASLDDELGADAAKARRWLAAVRAAGLAERRNGTMELTDTGTFWLHLAQNHFALAYVDSVWTGARREPWPDHVDI
ncbi:MAG: radical SAM protein [Actinobacteria bacterium]|nr:MAG: radical SAM protein [Actinomycetota bacterium]